MNYNFVNNKTCMIIYIYFEISFMIFITLNDCRISDVFYINSISILILNIKKIKFNLQSKMKIFNKLLSVYVCYTLIINLGITFNFIHSF